MHNLQIQLHHTYIYAKTHWLYGFALSLFQVSTKALEIFLCGWEETEVCLNRGLFVASFFRYHVYII